MFIFYFLIKAFLMKKYPASTFNLLFKRKKEQCLRCFESDSFHADYLNALYQWSSDFCKPEVYKTYKNRAIFLQNMDFCVIKKCFKSSLRLPLLEKVLLLILVPMTTYLETHSPDFQDGDCKCRFILDDVMAIGDVFECMYNTYVGNLFYFSWNEKK